MNAFTEHAVLATARANIYRFLAGVFLAPPTNALLAHVHDTEFRAAFADWVDDAEWDGIGTGSLDVLVLEFNCLFVAPGDTYVPPYESVYTDAMDIEYSPHQVSGAGDMPTRVTELLWGPSTTAVERAYAAAGFAVTRAAGELPDHLGIELQFLARLCDEESAAWSAEDTPEATRLQKFEQEFLRAHPLRWMARFRERLEAARAHPFYTTMARLCISFLQTDAALFAE